jgi:RNA polymerase sigma factor (sigma-70 family)
LTGAERHARGACNRGGRAGHIRGVTSGERFESLYAAHAPAVLAYARRRTDAASAQDVLAEVFLAAWRRLDAIPLDDGARLWLLGAARRVLANERRGQARRTALHARLAAHPSGAGAEAVQAPAPDMADGRVLEALASLGDGDREVLLLLGWEELTAQEAAQVLGIRAGTFAVRLHRSRRRFALALAATGHRTFPEQTPTLEAP